MTDKTSKRVFIIIWTLLLISFTANFLIMTFFQFIIPSKGLSAFLTTISSLIFSVSFFTGLFIYIMVGPWLLKKHGIKTFTESYLQLNCIYSEIELKKLEPSVNDSSVRRTLTVLRICKFGIVIGITMWILSAVL